MSDNDWRELQRLAVDMTGGETNNPTDAFIQWQNERETLTQLWDENQALQIHARALIVTLKLARNALTIVKQEAAMFVTQRGRDAVTKFEEQFKRVEKIEAEIEDIRNGQTSRHPAKHD